MTNLIWKLILDFKCNEKYIIKVNYSTIQRLLLSPVIFLETKLDGSLQTFRRWRFGFRIRYPYSACKHFVGANIYMVIRKNVEINVFIILVMSPISFVKIVYVFVLYTSHTNQIVTIF